MRDLPEYLRWNRYRHTRRSTLARSENASMLSVVQSNGDRPDQQTWTGTSSSWSTPMRISRATRPAALAFGLALLVVAAFAPAALAYTPVPDDLPDLTISQTTN